MYAPSEREHISARVKVIGAHDICQDCSAATGYLHIVNNAQRAPHRPYTSCQPMGIISNKLTERCDVVARILFNRITLSMEGKCYFMFSENLAVSAKKDAFEELGP